MKGIKKYIDLIKLVKFNVKQYIILQVVCFISLLVYTASSVIFPNYVGKIVDRGIASNDVNVVIRYSLEMLICGIIMIISFYIQKNQFYSLGNKVTLKMKNRIYDKITILNFQYWNNNKVGNVLTILDDDVQKMEEVLTNTLSDLIINTVLALGIGIYVIVLNAKIGITVIITAFVFAIAQKKVSSLARRKMNIFRKTLGSVNSFTMETVEHIPTIQMSGNSSYVRNSYQNMNGNLMHKNLDFLRTVSLVSVVGMSFNMLAIVTVLLIGAIDVQNGNLSVGLLFSLTIYVQRLYSPILNLGSCFVSIRSLAPVLEQITSLLNTTDVINSGKLSKGEALQGQIDFKDIDFKYDGGQNIFSNYSECIKAGEIVGIIGQNGSGKTTLSRLITRLVEVSGGVIQIDGVDIGDYDLDFLQSQVGCMTQDNFLLTDQLYDLIQDEEILEELKSYFKEMNFTEERIQELNVKERMWGENGTSISGGEAQKIALFKLYIENKPICILDEPTSALDPVSESKMIQFIKDKFNGKTLIIITHKKEILEICDRVIQMSQ